MGAPAGCGEPCKNSEQAADGQDRATTLVTHGGVAGGRGGRQGSWLGGCCRRPVGNDVSLSQLSHSILRVCVKVTLALMGTQKTRILVLVGGVTFSCYLIMVCSLAAFAEGMHPRVGEGTVTWVRPPCICCCVALSERLNLSGLQFFHL
jgi:hypothetical protein